MNKYFIIRNSNIEYLTEEQALSKKHVFQIETYPTQDELNEETLYINIYITEIDSSYKKGMKTLSCIGSIVIDGWIHNVDDRLLGVISNMYIRNVEFLQLLKSIVDIRAVSEDTTDLTIDLEI